MGGQSFIMRVKAMNVDEAYSRAVETAIREEGTDDYNGTISTTINCSNLTKQFRESKKDKMEFINSILEDARKRYCFAIEEQAPIKNNNKIKSVVEHNVIKGTSKWELQYNVYTGWEDRQLKSFKTKADAVKFAREHTEKTQTTTFVRMEKVLVNQNANVACIKYRSSSNDERGTYVLFGIAAC